MLGLNTLFVVCVRLCVRRGGEARGGADGQPLCSLLYCVHIYSLPLSLFIFYLSPFSPLFPSAFSYIMSSSFHSFFTTLFFFPLPSSFTLCCLVADGSMGQQQQQQSRSQSVSRRWGEEKGVVESKGGERRWGSGIWRAWLRGPLRGSVYVRVVV